MTEGSSPATRRSARLRSKWGMTDPFLWVISFCKLEVFKEVLFFTYTGIYRLLVHQLKFFVFLKDSLHHTEKTQRFCSAWRYRIIYTDCSVVALPKVQNHLAKSPSQKSTEVVLRNLQFLQEGAMEICRVILQEGATKCRALHKWRY
jgi:hypothetical protein